MNHVLLVLALAGPLVMVAAVLAIALARVAARPAPSPQGPGGDHDESEDAPAHRPGAGRMCGLGAQTPRLETRERGADGALKALVTHGCLREQRR